MNYFRYISITYDYIQLVVRLLRVLTEVFILWLLVLRIFIPDILILGVLVLEILKLDFLRLEILVPEIFVSKLPLLKVLNKEHW